MHREARSCFLAPQLVLGERVADRRPDGNGPPEHGVGVPPGAVGVDREQHVDGLPVGEREGRVDADGWVLRRSRDLLDGGGSGGWRQGCGRTGSSNSGGGSGWASAPGAASQARPRGERDEASERGVVAIRVGSRPRVVGARGRPRLARARRRHAPPWLAEPATWGLLARWTCATAYRRLGPISSTSSSILIAVVALAVLVGALLEAAGRDDRMPLVSDPEMCSANSRQADARRNSASPSFHSFVCRSSERGVDAIVKFATGEAVLRVPQLGVGGQDFRRR